MGSDLILSENPKVVYSNARMLSSDRSHVFSEIKSNFRKKMEDGPVERNVPSSRVKGYISVGHDSVINAYQVHET